MLRTFARAGLALAVMLALFTPRGTAIATFTQLPAPAPSHAPDALSLKLGNQVFNDLNNNGLRESGETGVPNVLVRLLDESTSGNTAVVGYTRTDARGKYVLDSLVPGAYSIEIVLPPMYLSSQNVGTSAAPDNGVDDDDNGVLLLGSVVRSHAVLVGAIGLPEDNLTLDFGIWQPASLGDWVWQDNNNDGLQQEGEPGLPNVEITLLDANNSPINTTRTDAEGHYIFDGLTRGDYAISVTLITGHEFSPQGRGNKGDSDVDPLTGRTPWVSLTSGETDANLDIGLFPIALQLSIMLTSQPAPSQPNDPSSVRPGDAVTYTIAITNIGNQTVTNIVVMNAVPVGATYITDTAQPNPDASSQPDALIWTAPALSATHSLTMRFAVRVNEGMGNALTKLRNEAVVQSDQTPPNTSNRISHDVVPPTAPGPAISIFVLPDVQTILVGSTAVFTVEVTNTGGFDLYGTEVHPTTATDCDHFIGVLAVNESASYTCKQASVMAPFTDTFTTISYAGRGSLVLSSFTAIVNLKPTARLGDYVWLDEDGDGTQRSNAGMPGVQVRLVNLTNVSATASLSESAPMTYSVIGITQITNAQGFYLFDDVPPGRYQVCGVPPAGHSFTRQGTNPNSGVDSDVDPATGCTRPITASAHVMDTSIDIGLVPVVMQLVQTAQPQPTNDDNQVHINIGDRITYTLSLHNAGLQPARNVVVTDVLPGDVQVISGTVQPTATSASGLLGWTVAELGSGERYTMSFAVRVMSKHNDSIQNLAFVETTQTPMAVSNGVVHVFLPTAVQLLSFAGRWVATGVELAWQTGAEVNSFGFALYRSETSDRSTRARVTPEWIAAKNSNSATYAFVDESARPSQRYTYWLTELERDGDVIEYDPIAVLPLNPAMANVPAGGVPMALGLGQPVAAPRVEVNAIASDAPTQAMEQVQAQAVVQPNATQKASAYSAQSAISAGESRSEPQPIASPAQSDFAQANVAPTQAFVAQPTQQAMAQPINTPNPTSMPKMAQLRVVEAASGIHLQAASSTSHMPLLWLVLAMASLLLILGLASVLLVLRVSIRADLSGSAGTH